MPLNDDEKSKIDRLFREEKAALEFDTLYDRNGLSTNNVAHVANHELMLSLLEKYTITRQGFINGHIRALMELPYWLCDDEIVGEGEE